jgi:type I restriction enzyme, R subunit
MKDKKYNPDKRNHVEKPLLVQLSGLDWEILDLVTKQHSADAFSENFCELIIRPYCAGSLRRSIPGWKRTKVEAVVKQLTANSAAAVRSIMTAGRL